MDAYEIRLELLKMSKDLLMEEWNRKHMALENVYYQKRDIAMAQEHNQYIVDFPELPPAVTSDNITELANKLNEFVSRRV
ncbi:hypothetical protein UFOVP29_187 [uncultured Caudovirales phage]|uniref:Uncharacterized protein n=1 Tax=uncultured Caudovirales phage TaxID=2100421 RepID=A0A6J5KLC5_9CAUD|nr:hypothetical protein UFOVP29_187 [uncultured Caudovirales phage]